MSRTAPLIPDSLGSAALLTSVAGLLRAWLPRQRWFAGKGRPVTDLTLLSVTELHPGFLHLLVHAQHGGGAPPFGDCYQLLLGVREALPPRLVHAFIGRATVRVRSTRHSPDLTP